MSQQPASEAPWRHLSAAIQPGGLREPCYDRLLVDAELTTSPFGASIDGSDWRCAVCVWPGRQRRAKRLRPPLPGGRALAVLRLERTGAPLGAADQLVDDRSVAGIRGGGVLRRQDPGGQPRQ